MKNFILAVVVFLLITFGGYFFIKNNSQQKLLQKQVEKVVNQKKQEVVEGIKEMVYKNVSLKCTYETPTGTKVTAYIKGTEKIRTTFQGKEKVDEAIFLKGKMYIWDNKTKQGMTMTVNQIKPQKNDEKTIIEDPAKYVEELEKTKAKCSQESLPDSIFQPPNDIKFQDLDKIQEMMNQGNIQIPQQETEE